MISAISQRQVFNVNDLNLWYGNNQALKNIQFDVNENEVTAIIGPSGCGKSTFIKTLNLMIQMVPNVKMSGEILFDGKNILSNKVDLVELRKNVGMVFQKGNPFPQSIYDNVTYGPKIHGTKKKGVLDEIVEKSLKDVALWDEVKDRLNAPALGLSGGQQQRLCIARALATKPEVLLMDEPTSALDPISTMKIEELVLELKEKYTIVMVTHNMQQASRVSDKTAFFLMGELVEMDNTEKIFSNPEDKRTEDYVTGRFG
ncbi:phosphate ABC transporter ATP-binding protein PstB [Falsibacillus pallidus]|uniref:Phosphate ABC transporter ATP-binding protein (PhoT family) n=1 Tax=Falsibacillus pallidus TaxID=493781 RepID=A0A370GPT7_9BACI|nr:phosphate ABC transporter ATP-binding protein PstB [Falsibacillus pallidus]RDI43963.1 phosphate ABC transporter ATP-binding protein (PhoT family) [Falsibacillus pallidus]